MNAVIQPIPVEKPPQYRVVRKYEGTVTAEDLVLNLIRAHIS